MKSSPGYCTKKQNIQVGLLIKQCPGCTLELQTVILNIKQSMPILHKELN